jgi:hypothetical protein
MVVGKAKVMGYNNIVEAQANGNAKEGAVVKEKRTPKRKNSTPVVASAKMIRKGEAEVAEHEINAMRLGNYCSVLQL